MRGHAQLLRRDGVLVNWPTRPLAAPSPPSLPLSLLSLLRSRYSRCLCRPSLPVLAVSAVAVAVAVAPRPAQLRQTGRATAALPSAPPSPPPHRLAAHPSRVARLLRRLPGAARLYAVSAPARPRPLPAPGRSFGPGETAPSTLITHPPPRP